MTFVFNIPSPTATFVFSVPNVTYSSGGSSAGDIEIYLDGVLIDTQATSDFNTETVTVEWL
jgi:hypothetical protein